MEGDWRNGLPPQFADIAEGVMADIKSKLGQMNNGPGVIESFTAFVHAVDWKVGEFVGQLGVGRTVSNQQATLLALHAQNEPWLQGLLAVQAAILISAILFRRFPMVQLVIFFCSATVVYFAERINSIAAQHWERFATQAYFDSHGIFCSAVLSAPLLLSMFVILVRS